jgi:hypothetical protein
MTVMGANPPRHRRAGESEIDSMIGAAWHRLMSGVQVPVMDIPRIFRDIKLEMAGGASLEDAVRAVGSRYRVNRNPGIGEAIVGGVAGALASRAFRNNPLETDPCAMCGGPVGYLGTLGRVEYYQCRNCGWERRGGQDPSVHVIRRLRPPRRRKPSPPKENPAISRSWDSLKLRPRLAILEFAGIPYEQARRLAARLWETLPPGIQEEVRKGWQENSRGSYLRPKGAKIFCVTCGEWLRSKGPYHTMKVGPQKGRVICDLCYRGIRSGRRAGESWARNPSPNPGPRSKRKLTMTIERFAEWVKAKRDPAMWRAFLAKFKGYEKWTHGARARKVTLEWVDTPGVNGLWITYDGGKQPESTYIMPKGSKRKGAWKHPWDTMPDIKHDPEARIVLTKLRGKSKITDFYHK